jgi:hypothetical protein
MQESTLERDTVGFLENWAFRMAGQNLVQCPAVVVHRSVYEAIGGFNPALHFTADWDMWKRVALHTPVLFVPEVLALYRQHEASWTTKLNERGETSRDARLAIEMAETYLPPEIRRRASAHARRHYGGVAMHAAGRCAARHDLIGFRAHMAEALRMSWHWKVLARLGLALSQFATPRERSETSAKN